MALPLLGGHQERRDPVRFTGIDSTPAFVLPPEAAAVEVPIQRSTSYEYQVHGLLLERTEPGASDGAPCCQGTCW
jgi:hypothetical protein